MIVAETLADLVCQSCYNQLVSSQQLRLWTEAAPYQLPFFPVKFKSFLPQPQSCLWVCVSSLVTVSLLYVTAGSWGLQGGRAIWLAGGGLTLTADY